MLLFFVFILLNRKNNIFEKKYYYLKKETIIIIFIFISLFLTDHKGTSQERNANTCFMVFIFFANFKPGTVVLRALDVLGYVFSRTFYFVKLKFEKKLKLKLNVIFSIVVVYISWCPGSSCSNVFHNRCTRNTKCCQGQILKLLINGLSWLL